MTIKEFYRQYLNSVGQKNTGEEFIETDRFGDSSELADKLCTLVLSGEKTASCSSLLQWEAEKKELPTVGLKTLILDGNDSPKCIIETTGVDIKKFSEVDSVFASEEGEGDKSLEHWRQAHKKFFTRNLKKINKDFSEDMDLVCERFKVIYKIP